MHFKLYRIVLTGALAAALFSGNARAESLSGKVLDPQGRPVAKATLKLFDRTGGGVKTIVSAADGTYTFEGISEGNYLVEGHSGEALKVLQEVTIRGDQKADLALAISSQATEVLVTAADLPQSVQEVGKALDVVGSDQIAERDELSIPEALRNLPGIRVRQLEGPGSTTTITVRGMRPQDTAVLLDGLRFRDAASPQGDASGFLQAMVVADTDRIEFLRGSGSSLYGSHALGGVINVTSKMGGGKPHGQFLSEGGGLGLFRNQFSVGGGIAKDRLTYSNTVSHLNTFKGVRSGLPHRNTSNQGALRFNITPKMSVTGRVWYAHDYMTATESPTFTAAVLANSPSSGPVRAVALPLDQLEQFEGGQTFNAGNATFIPNQIDPDGHRTGTFFNTAVTFQHQVSSGTSYRVTLQQVSTKRRYVDGPLGPGTFEPFSETLSNFNGYTLVGKAQIEQRAGAYNHITFGYEFEGERFLNFGGTDYVATAFDSIELKQRSNALYVQDQISLLDGALQITAAGRTQFFSLRAPVFGGATSPYAAVAAVEPPTAYTGDGAIAYFFKDSKTKLRAHVGNSFRAPSPFERYGGGFGSYYGDPTLSPERAIAVDGGFDQWLYGSRVQLSATMFYTSLQQTVLFANSLPLTDAYGRFFGYANGGGGINRGVELSGKFAPTARTSVEASYTFVNADSDTPTITGTTYHQVLGVSPHTFNFAITQSVGRVTVAYDMRVLSDYSGILFGGGARQFVFTGPVTADVVVRYRIPVADRSVEVYGKVNNLFNQRPFENGFVGPKAWAIAGIAWKY